MLKNGENRMNRMVETKYTYWINPAPRPKAVPEGCERLCDKVWVSETRNPEHWTAAYRRWPRNIRAEY